MPRMLLVILLAGAALMQAVGLAAAPATPKPGSPERKAILDALRRPVEKELGQRVVFRVDRLRVDVPWAFLQGEPVRPDGKPVDYRKTPYREAIEAGAFDDGIFALLRRGKSGWKVLEYEIGATDVPWEPWPKRHGAPRSIFPYAR